MELQKKSRRGGRKMLEKESLKSAARTPRNDWESSFMKSLQKLNIQKLDSLLLHRSADLLGSDGEKLLDWLQSLQARGLVDRIGVSIYEASELEKLPLHHLQVVQLPLSLYDQRMIQSETLKLLDSLDIAIHARSIFLQGLMLQPSEYWPTHISFEFKSQHDRWLQHKYTQVITPQEATLAFVRECREIKLF